jgi:uncharacterized repeat protein (TIGR01451 family)
MRALLALLLSLYVSPAVASCSAANQYNFSFANQTAGQLSYGSSYSYSATSTALGSQSFTVQPVAPTGYNAVTTAGTFPNISTTINGGTGNAMVIGGTFAGRTTSITSATNVVATTLTFPMLVRDLTFTIHDVDYTVNQYRDWIYISGTSAAGTYVPALTTPFSMANISGPFTNASSSVKFGVQAAPIAVGASEGVGVGLSGNNSTTGNITAYFGQPVTSVTIRYGSYPLQTGETTTGQQAFGISTISWCPMPSLTMVKSSTTVVSSLTDPLHMNIPGSDTYYSITVANTNTSPVDANAVFVTDILPPTMTFYNGDIDDTGPLTANFDFLPGTSGLTLSGTNIAYSNNGGITYAYAPVAGYDPAAQALRFNPLGTMAANSSFTIRFRSRIK